MIKHRLKNGRIAPSIPLRRWTIDAMAERVVGPLPTQCWIISGCEIMYGKGGHARYRQYGKRSFVHRLSYEAFKGQIPEGLCVCHQCDNPPCCNPDHLFLATNEENTADRVAKGRSRRGHKLTEEQVATIRFMLNEGKIKQVDIARRFGVSNITISAIKYGRIHKRNNIAWSTPQIIEIFPNQGGII